MAEGEGGGGGWGTLIAFFAILIALVAFWIYRGAPGHEDMDSWFTKSPISGETGYLPFVSDTGSPVYSNSSNTKKISGYQDSAQNGSVEISYVSGSYSSDPSQEYITLQANRSNQGPIVISGWKLKSLSSEKSATIGGGIALPLQGVPQSNGAVVLNPGERAVITTGRSPVGMSFKENKCTGYFSQFQQFSPTLSGQCPYPSEELSQANSAISSDQSCMQAATLLPSCQALTIVPPNVSQMCQQFLTQTLTYNGCVALHQNDSNFSGQQWRVFLGLSQELWNNRGDVIVLLDSSGKLVASTSY